MPINQNDRCFVAKTTTRIAKIVTNLPICNTLADVGCDHGYVGISALVGGKAKQVVFCDVSAPSLAKARQNCPTEHLHCATFVCQNGLQNVVCDCAVIAGMGGLEIISILQNAKHAPQTLVLQPMRNQADVRQFVNKHYEIVTDSKFFDGKFYDLIVATQAACPQPLTQLQLQFGKTNLVAPTADFVAFLRAEQQKYTQILQGYAGQDIQQKLEVINGLLAKQED